MSIDLLNCSLVTTAGNTKDDHLSNCVNKGKGDREVESVFCLSSVLVGLNSEYNSWNLEFLIKKTESSW